MVDPGQCAETVTCVDYSIAATDFGTMSGSAIEQAEKHERSRSRHAVAGFFHHLTAEHFLRLGVSSVVYLRSSMVGDDPTYAIHSADGVLVSLVEDIEAATLRASDYGMAIVAVH